MMWTALTSISSGIRCSSPPRRPDNPLRAITRLKWVEGDTFRRVRDDEEPGEDIVFERDPSGRVTGYRQFGNLSPRVR